MSESVPKLKKESHAAEGRLTTGRGEGGTGEREREDR